MCHVIRRVLTPTSDTTRDAAADVEVTPGANLEEAADMSAIDDVEAAYESVKSVSPLDISKEGSEAWDGAIQRYDERIDRVETRITARLRDQLGTAKNANEMFRIFSRYNALFVRPHIRGAIREYQTQLIQRVKDDIEQLHNKFKVSALFVVVLVLSDCAPPHGCVILLYMQLYRTVDLCDTRVFMNRRWCLGYSCSTLLHVNHTCLLR